MTQSNVYNHGTRGDILALRVNPLDRKGAPLQADWKAVRRDTGEMIGYVTDQRCDDGGEPSDVPSVSEDSLDYEAYNRKGTYITSTHSLRGALATIGHHA